MMCCSVNSTGLAVCNNYRYCKCVRESREPSRIIFPMIPALVTSKFYSIGDMSSSQRQLRSVCDIAT